MYHYIQIDDNGIPVSDSYLSGPVSGANMIYVDDDFDPTGKKYENGEWVDYVDPMEDAISEQEESELEMQANIQYLVDLAEINMEV